MFQIKINTLLRLLLVFAFPTTIESSEVHENKFSTQNDREKTLNEESKNKGRLIPKLNLWYISKPSSASVDILCRGNIKSVYFHIVCPTLDHEMEENILKSALLPHVEKMNSEQTTPIDNGYSNVTRRLPWKKIEKLSKFSCLCQIQMQTKVNDAEVAKINVLNIGLEKNDIKPLRRRINAKKYIRIQCGVTGGPALQITWYKNGKPLKLNGTTWVNGTEYVLRKNRLRISRTDQRGSGYYKCLARNMAGKEWGQRHEVFFYETSNRTFQICHHNDSCENPTDTSNHTCNKELERDETICTGSTFIKSSNQSSNGDEYDEQNDRKIKVNSKKSFSMIGIVVIGVTVFLLVIIIGALLLSQKVGRQFLTRVSCHRSGSYREGRRLSCHVQPCSTLCSSDTSSLLATLDSIPSKVDQRYYASGLIDHNGGQLILNNTGIKLIIPEGAISKSKTEVIYIALIETEQYFPQLEEGESLLSPVIMCGPHGLRFKKDVLLVLPHCVAIGERNNTKFRVLCSDTAPDKNTNWREIFNTEKDPCDHCFCSMDESYFTLFVPHFSWYAIPGNCQTKMFSVIAYHSRFLEPLEHFKIRMYCIPDFEKSRKQVEKEEEEKLNGVICDGSKWLTFCENGGELLIETTHISEGWKIVNIKNKKIDYFMMWNCSMKYHALTFILESAVPRPRQVYCTFNVVQKELKENFQPIEVITSFVFPAQQVPQSPTNLSIASSSGYVSSGENTNVGFLPKELKNSLILSLDPPILGRRDYRVLAEKMNFDSKFGNWLEKTENRNPTERLLTTWEYTVRMDPPEALCHLRDMLKEMGRDDCVEEVDKYCLHFPKQRKETTV